MKTPRLLLYQTTKIAAYKSLYMVAWRYVAYSWEIAGTREWQVASRIVQYNLASVPQ